MTKKEAKESLVSALREQGVDYTHEGDVFEFEGLVVRFDSVYVVLRHGTGRVYYPLSELSHITIMDDSLWVSTTADYNFSVIYF
jgi:hypothetical protein